jgi:hypothetical protein
MLADVRRSEEDASRAVDQSRSALTLLDAGLNDLSDFSHRFKQIRANGGAELRQEEFAALQPSMDKAHASTAKAAAAAAQAWQSYNVARARRLQTRIALLGLDFPRTRYATLQNALRQRCGNDGLPYDEMLRDGLTPGEAATASIAGAEAGVSPETIAREARAGGRNIVDVASARNVDAFALEIFLRLVYLDYTDDPSGEARDAPNAAPTIPPLTIRERS